MRGLLSFFEEVFKKLREKNKGFSLVELLVVVGIIGLLVAVVMPHMEQQLQLA